MTQPDPMIRIVDALSRRDEWKYLMEYFQNHRKLLLDSLVYGNGSEFDDASTKGIVKGIDMILRIESEYLGD